MITAPPKNYKLAALIWRTVLEVLNFVGLQLNSSKTLTFDKTLRDMCFVNKDNEKNNFKIGLAKDKIKYLGSYIYRDRKKEKLDNTEFAKLNTKCSRISLISNSRTKIICFKSHISSKIRYMLHGRDDNALRLKIKNKLLQLARKALGINYNVNSELIELCLVGDPRVTDILRSFRYPYKENETTAEHYAYKYKWYEEFYNNEEVKHAIIQRMKYRFSSQIWF